MIWFPTGGRDFSTSPNWPEELRGAANLIPNTHQEFSTQRQSSLVVQLITNLHIQGGSNMTGTDLCVNKPHCAAAVRPWESEATTSTLPPARVRTCSVLSGSCFPHTVVGVSLWWISADGTFSPTRNLITMRCSTLRGTFCSLITLAAPRKDWTGSNPSRREGGGCGFTLSSSHICCAVRLVYTQIRSRSYLNHLVHERYWNNLSDFFPCISYIVCIIWRWPVRLKHVVKYTKSPITKFFWLMDYFSILKCQLFS